ncbi:integrase catalytic domain-containing protein [Trichonephila clavipes]|nr:integrase catalytic domain-containing protein [Trichonephila clavipes]
MAPKELSELTVFNRRKAHLLGQITRIRNSSENVDSPLNKVEIRTKLASLSEVKAKIDKLQTESYRVLSDEELMDFEASLNTMEVDADNLEVDRNLTKFWDLEAIGIKAESSCDPDDQAMQHFKSSVRFNSGRYEVGFPWKGHTQELNDNFSVAEKRVKSLTRRFIRDPTLYIQYSEILKEYESQGIIERVLETENQLIEQYSIYRTKRSFAKKA